jgi:hypothetical protein
MHNVKITLVIFVCYFQWCAIRVASKRNAILTGLPVYDIGEMKSESLLSMSKQKTESLICLRRAHFVPKKCESSHMKT